MCLYYRVLTDHRLTQCVLLIQEHRSSVKDIHENDKTNKCDTAGDDDDDDKSLEPLVIDQFVDETSQRPPLLTDASCQRRLPADVLGAPASGTAVLRVLDRHHADIVANSIYSKTSEQKSHSE